MVAYEALYGCKCRTPLCWTELGERRVLSLELVSETEDKLKLPPKLDHIHDVFHVSMLKHYRSDPLHIVPVEEIKVRPDWTFEEEPVQVLDHDIKVLKKNFILLMKVLWRNHNIEKAMWEPEDVMCQQYPYLF
ncbi:uncharacterized protein [Gossypium hirsutum]|uniref:Chromo domain-containing protein n=1 Tax=Gossypium hirsutum TaxID=3635 RepID=A0A1U8MCV5_GOSHI|nr:uncharacterized protein LOC107936469 [Gossypium hirsutum]